MTGLDPAPARASAWVAAATALGAAAVLVAAGSPGAPIAVFGLASLLFGLGLPIQRLVHAGGLGLLIGAVWSGLTGIESPAVIAGFAGGYLAWALGVNALSIGDQLGRAAPTARLEFIHAVATLGVVGLSAGIAYAVWRLSPVETIRTGLVPLLVAAVLIAVALSARPWEREPDRGRRR